MTAHDSTRWDLEHALSSEGCPICRVTQVGAARFLDELLYESVNDPDTRRRATKSLGFCNSHAWQLRSRHGSSLGIALLYRDALQQWQNQLDAVSQPNGRASAGQLRQQFAQANAPQAKCLACERQADIERRYIAVLIESLADRAFADALRASAGLCRPHFAQASDATKETKTLDALAEIQSAINQRLLGELDEFIRKNDYRFMGEGFGAEGDSWIRALERLSGAGDASR